MSQGRKSQGKRSSGKEEGKVGGQGASGQSMRDHVENQGCNTSRRGGLCVQEFFDRNCVRGREGGSQ